MEFHQSSWSGLQNQITALARYSQAIIPIGIIIGATSLFCIFSGVATGWLASLIFSVGKSGRQLLIWQISGYIFGFALAFLLLINIIYGHLSKIKLTDDAQDIEGQVDRITYGFFNVVARTTTILACAMFIYAHVSGSNDAAISYQKTRAEKIAAHRAIMERNRQEFYQMKEYFQSLDFDNDRSNDDWARAQLQKIVENRAIQQQKEDSILQELISLPDRPPQLAQAPDVLDGTALLRDITAPDTPGNWGYRILLVVLGIIIGFCTEGGIALGGKIIARKKAFENVRTVLSQVNEVMREITGTYDDRKPVKYDESSKFSKFSKVLSKPPLNGKTAQKSGGEGINWDNPRVQKIINDIENHWTENGGDCTFEQIGEMNECTKSYVSQLFRAAVEANKIIDPRLL